MGCVQTANDGGLERPQSHRGPAPAASLWLQAGLGFEDAEAGLCGPGIGIRDRPVLGTRSQTRSINPLVRTGCEDRHRKARHGESMSSAA